MKFLKKLTIKKLTMRLIIENLIYLINFYYFRVKIKNLASKSKFNSISIDLTNYLSKLCFIGGKFGTDKSILNVKTYYQHAYTGIYNILFANLKNKKINIAEIGIFQNGSIRMFREFFKNSTIDGFEIDNQLIENARRFNLPRTNYYKIDVKNAKSIEMSFKKSRKKYDIIIDDSTHEFEDQINIIYKTKKFLKAGGFLIIEDIFENKGSYSEENYYLKLKNISSEFSNITFIKCNHKYNFGGLWFNHKLLVLNKHTK